MKHDIKTNFTYIFFQQKQFYIKLLIRTIPKTIAEKNLSIFFISKPLKPNNHVVILNWSTIPFSSRKQNNIRTKPLALEEVNTRPGRSTGRHLGRTKESSSESSLFRRLATLLARCQSWRWKSGVVFRVISSHRCAVRSRHRLECFASYRLFWVLSCFSYGILYEAIVELSVRSMYGEKCSEPSLLSIKNWRFYLC